MLLYYLASAFRALQPRFDDDFVDQLNHYYTTTMLIAFAILVSAKQYVGQAIQCWVPATFTEPMEQYAENFCWVQGTYWLPYRAQIPFVHRGNYRGDVVAYYQWVPFILALQALMFYIPCIVWRGFMYWKSSMNLEGLIHLARDCQLMDPEVRHRTIVTVGRHLEERFRMDFVSRSRQNSMPDQFCGISLNPSIGGYCCSPVCGATLTVIYVFSKILYAANALLQFVILNHFLGTEDLFYGFHVLRQLLNQEEWHSTGRFPRVTLCDFDVRVLGNLHRHTVQCVIMVNMFNEKIFIFLWYWLMTVVMVTGFNILYWVTAMFWPDQNFRFVRKYMSALSDSSTKPSLDGASLAKFVDEYLRTDGVFMLRMVSVHAGEMITSELVYALWGSFIRLQRSNFYENETTGGGSSAGAETA